MLLSLRSSFLLYLLSGVPGFSLMLLSSLFCSCFSSPGSLLMIPVFSSLLLYFLYAVPASFFLLLSPLLCPCVFPLCCSFLFPDAPVFSFCSCFSSPGSFLTIHFSSLLLYFLYAVPASFLMLLSPLLCPCFSSLRFLTPPLCSCLLFLALLFPLCCSWFLPYAPVSSSLPFYFLSAVPGSFIMLLSPLLCPCFSYLQYLPPPLCSCLFIFAIVSSLCSSWFLPYAPVSTSFSCISSLLFLVLPL